MSYDPQPILYIALRSNTYLTTPYVQSPIPYSTISSHTFTLQCPMLRHIHHTLPYGPTALPYNALCSNAHTLQRRMLHHLYLTMSYAPTLITYNALRFNLYLITPSFPTSLPYSAYSNYEIFSLNDSLFGHLSLTTLYVPTRIPYTALCSNTHTLWRPILWHLFIPTTIWLGTPMFRYALFRHPYLPISLLYDTHAF